MSKQLSKEDIDKGVESGISSHSCGGKCCKVFSMPYLTHKELQEKKADLLEDKRRSEKSGIGLSFSQKQNLTVYDMLIPLALEEAYHTNPYYFKKMTESATIPIKFIDLGWGELVKWMDENKRHWYRDMNFYGCKHLTDEGLCGIYEKRPIMCSSYPNKHFCGHDPDCEAVNLSKMAQARSLEQLEVKSLPPGTPDEVQEEYEKATGRNTTVTRKKETKDEHPTA